MGIFSCFSRPKVTDGVDAGAYNVEGLDAKDGVTPGGSPGKGRRAAGSESLSGSPRKRIDYDSLVKSKQMPGNSGASGASGSVELANARALVRALARKPESRYVSCTHVCGGAKLRMLAVQTLLQYVCKSATLQSCMFSQASGAHGRT